MARSVASEMHLPPQRTLRLAVGLASALVATSLMAFDFAADMHPARMVHLRDRDAGAEAIGPDGL